MTMLRFRRADPAEMTDAYVAETREAAGQRWQRQGIVARYGQPGNLAWNALAEGTDAWTDWKPTRAAAAAEMLAGHTWLTRQSERVAARHAAEIQAEPGDFEAG